MEFQYTLSVIRDVLAIVAILGGGLTGIFIYLQFAPQLELEIGTRWADESKKHLIVSYHITNKSRVRIDNAQAKTQFLKHDPNETHQLSAWVPFQEGKIKNEEKPKEWQEPEKIFETSKRIYPGESIRVEQLYHVPEKRIVIHIGLQISFTLSLFGKLFARHWGEWGQTTTCIVTKL